MRKSRVKRFLPNVIRRIGQHNPNAICDPDDPQKRVQIEIYLCLEGAHESILIVKTKGNHGGNLWSVLRATQSKQDRKELVVLDIYDTVNPGNEYFKWFATAAELAAKLYANIKIGEAYA